GGEGWGRGVGGGWGGPDGGRMRGPGTPARHGPAGIEPFSGDVIGFVLGVADHPPVYVTGDTVWYDGVAGVACRFPARAVLLFARAAPHRRPVQPPPNTKHPTQTPHPLPH